MKTKCLLITSLLFGVCSAHAQLNVNVFNALHGAQIMLQKPPAAPNEPATAVSRPSGGGKEQAQSASSDPTFGVLFGCDQPASKPLLSTFALHDIRLGDVCAQSELTTGSPTGMVRGVENDMRQLMPTQNIAITQLSGGGATVTLATVRAAARPAGFAKSVVVGIYEHVNATDVTNSLQPGNSFRIALEQKYGKPDRIFGAREKLSADHKAAEAQVNGTAQALGINNSEAVAKSIGYKDQVAKQWVACHPADTVYELQWTNPDGTLLSAKLADGECGSNPSFELTLQPNPTLPQESRFLWSQWVAPLAAFQKAQTQARSTTAPTPKF